MGSVAHVSTAGAVPELHAGSPAPAAAMQGAHMVPIKQRKAARLRLALKDAAAAQLERGGKGEKQGKKPPWRAFPSGCSEPGSGEA